MEKEFKLPNRKVKVTPIRRKGAWLPPTHEASFLFGTAKKGYTVPLKGNNLPLRILTPEEESYLSKAIDKDLNVHKNPKENYWLNKIVFLTKDIKILDLSDPSDYIEYKILLAQKDEVAEGGDKKFSKGTYKYFIDDVDYQEKKQAESTQAKTNAYIYLGQLSTSTMNMKNFLSAYYINKPGLSVPLNATSEFLQGELGKLVEKDLDGFLALKEDSLYEEKVLLANAISKQAITKEGTKYILPDSKDVIASNTQDALLWLKDTVNSEEVLKIKARIEL